MCVCVCVTFSVLRWVTFLLRMNFVIWIELHILPSLGFPRCSVGKESACIAGDLGSIPGLGRSSGEGNGNSLQYSGLENPMDREAWWATVHKVTKSWTQLKRLSMHACTHIFFKLFGPNCVRNFRMVIFKRESSYGSAPLRVANTWCSSVFQQW